MSRYKILQAETNLTLERIPMYPEETNTLIYKNTLRRTSKNKQNLTSSFGSCSSGYMIMWDEIVSSVLLVRYLQVYTRIQSWFESLAWNWTRAKIVIVIDLWSTIEDSHLGSFGELIQQPLEMEILLKIKL